MLPGLWFELFGAHRCGRGAQLPNHPCAYLLPDWSAEESHWLPVCIIQPGCFCLSSLLNPHSSLKKKKKKSPFLPVSASEAFQIYALFRFLWGSISLKWTLSLFLVSSFKFVRQPLFLTVCFALMPEWSTKTFMIDIASFDYRLHVLRIKFLAVSGRPPPPTLPREAFFALGFCAV